MTAVRRAVPWLAVLVPAVEVLLVLSGVLPVRVAVVVALLCEALFAVVVVAEWVAFRAAWRAERARGGRRGEALLAGVAAAAPPPLARVARAELATWRSLWWAVRRRRAVAAGQVPLSYTSRIGVMLGVVIALTPLEVLVVHLLLPWPAVRVAVVVLSAVSLLWLVGFALALRQRPHVLDDDRLVLRFGSLRELSVPLDGLVDARAATTLDHRRNLSVADGVVALSVLGESSVRLQLRPGSVVDLDGAGLPAEQVAFFADDPRAAVRELRARREVAR